MTFMIAIAVFVALACVVVPIATFAVFLLRSDGADPESRPETGSRSLSSEHAPLPRDAAVRG